MVSIDEDISPASIPTTSTLIWSEERSSKDTVCIDEKVIKFNKSSCFRFERTEENFDSNSKKSINLRIKYTDSDHHICCLGLAWENNLDRNKGSYYFNKSIMYSSYYPKVTICSEDLDYQKFKVYNNNLVRITFDSENMKIKYEHNGVDLGEINIRDKKINNEWYFVVGMFEGEIEIID